MRLRVGVRTDTGRVRDLNEDVYALRAEQGLFVVCDGMGGCPAGEVASRMAADVILRSLNAPRQTIAAAGEDRRFLPVTARLAEAVRRSNEFIYDHARSHPARSEMGTTVVSAWIAEHIASVAHVGDSRAYLWHRGRLEALTRDHSLANAHGGGGPLDRESILRCDHQNVLLRVVGREPQVDVDLKEVALLPGDYLVLCSDGLTRMVTEQSLTQAIGRIRDPQRICDYLVDAANNNGGADNITVVVVEIMESWWRRVSDRWRRPIGGGHDGETYSALRRSSAETL